MKTKQVAVIFACAFPFACNQPTPDYRSADQKEKDKAEEERKEKKEADIKSLHTSREAPKSPFATYDLAAAKQAWQGAWVVQGETEGSHVAWMIEGDKLRQFDGENERELQFEVFSPCQVGTTDKGEGLTSYTNFLIVGDQVHVGLGWSGKVIGDATIVCEGSKTYVLTGDKCEAWSEEFDAWKSEPATCKVEGEGAERKFVVDAQSIPFLDATSLASDQMKASVAQKHPDYEAAKAALTAPPTPAPAEPEPKKKSH